MVRSIAANHALVDGNKRLAVTVLHATLLVNGYLYLWDDDVAVLLMERCATGDTDYHWLADFLTVWTRLTEVKLPLDSASIGGELRVIREAKILEKLGERVTEICRSHASGHLSTADVLTLIQQ